MSDEFLRAARKEIEGELDGMGRIVLLCNNDEDIFNNSNGIEGHLHKIKGLAPMMGKEMIGDIAKTADIIMKHIIVHGSLKGSNKFIIETIECMKNLLGEEKSFDMNDFRKRAHEIFPEISSL
jgi:hypothetical protein